MQKSKEHLELISDRESDYHWSKWIGTRSSDTDDVKEHKVVIQSHIKS